MQRGNLRYDDENMFSSHVGKSGVALTEWRKIHPRLRKAKAAVLRDAKKEIRGFLTLPKNEDALSEIQNVYTDIPAGCTDLVVIGIGGSDLGARAILKACRPQGRRIGRAMRVHFTGSTTDPDELSDLLSNIDLKRTALNIVSKSGSTIEPMAVFSVLRDLLIRRVGEREHRKRIIVTTDPEQGILLDLARRHRYHHLAIPSNVGGRYSVLTACGLFPALAGGIDIQAMLQGAQHAVKSFTDFDVDEDISCRMAGIQAIQVEKYKRRIHVYMTYRRRLDECTRWIRQLVAESLGKKQNRARKTIYQGVTPISSIGPEDQHSQLQLYAEGPFDKLVTFIDTKKQETEILTPHEQDPSLRAYSNLSLGLIRATERSATAEALRVQKRPNATMLLEDLDPKSLGEFFMTFQIQIALLGELFDVDAYDQPGVELSKTIMKRQLGIR